MKALLYDYRYRNNKEFYNCSIKKITDCIYKCDKIVKGSYHCDKCKKDIESTDISRHVSIDSNLDENADIVIGLFTDYDEVDEEQEGGYISIDDKYIHEYKYLKYKSKYLSLFIEHESNNKMQ